MRLSQTVFEHGNQPIEIMREPSSAKVIELARKRLKIADSFEERIYLHNVIRDVLHARPVVAVHIYDDCKIWVKWVS